jgi:hypothetical protein
MQFLVLVVLLAVLTATAAETASQKILKNLRPYSKNYTQKTRAEKKSNLRTEANSYASVSLTGQSQGGFFEEAYYAGINEMEDQCIHPQFKYLYVLNQCVTSAVTGQSFYDQAVIDSQGNTYYVYETTYSDTACTQVVGSGPELLYEQKILICKDLHDDNALEDDLFYNDYSLFHTRNYPLNPQHDNMGFTFLSYNTQGNCQTNNYHNGVYESSYYHFNECMESWTGGVDTMAVSCSTNGLVMNEYSTTDGTCGGIPTETVTYMHNAMCTESAPYLYTSGWLNFACMGVHPST